MYTQYSYHLDPSHFPSQLTTCSIPIAILQFKYLTFGLNIIHQIIQPRPQSVCSLADLQLYNWNSTEGIAIGTEVRFIARMLVHVVASPTIAFRRPPCGTLLRCRRVAASQPHVWRLIEQVFSNAQYEVVEEWVDGLGGERLANVCCVVGNIAVPHLIMFSLTYTWRKK
jgi:hypothetical protein